MIMREVVEFVGEADFTDDCRVKVWMRKRRSTLTVTEAKALRAELDKAIGEAERGLADLLRTTEPFGFDMVELLSPDCKVGKHPAGWVDTAWDDAADAEVPCQCACHDAEVTA